MDAHLIFPSMLCVDMLADIDNDKLQSFAYNLQNGMKSRSFSNKGGWQSDFIEHELIVQPLIEEIDRRLESLRDTLKYRDETSLNVESMWFNINKPYSYNSLHSHPGSYLSGVYYIKVPSNSGNISFRHPSALQPIITSHNAFKEYNNINCSKWFEEPAAGKFILFPSWLEHEVSQNLSNEDRISIAFNTQFVN